MEYPVQFSVDYRSRNAAPAMTHTRTNNQVTDEGVQLSLSPGDALASVQEGGKLGAVMLVLDHRAYLEDSLQLTGRSTCMVADFDELMVVVGYLTLMPRHEDGLDVGKVLCTEWRARSRSLRQNSTSSPTRVRARGLGGPVTAAGSS